MNDKEKIRAEIERLKENHESNLDKPMERGRIGHAHGYVDCCDEILDFIDSLPEPSCPEESDDLEKAVDAEIVKDIHNLLHVKSGPLPMPSEHKFGDKVRIIILPNE